MSSSPHRFRKGVERCLHCGLTRAEARALAALWARKNVQTPARPTVPR
ncbi:MAG TPA: hypothetical protein VEW95_09230 [Candidatus Limnocylindrales bacterium]|nr:hypothetical protein [Candidatus Limnocylindrales bacterium]